MAKNQENHRLSKDGGKVIFVGAGPGDPKLITLRGMDELRRATVILYDYLVNPSILRAVPATTRLICLGRHGIGRLWSQDEINAQLCRDAQAGERVVRLKGGDPGTFGRLGEETAALRAAGISFEIVPGVTTALVAGSYAGIPITDRDSASAVALVTGHRRGDLPETKLNYESLAAFPGTLVFYMGITTAPDWTAALIAAGKSPTTPAAIIRRCSLPDQVTYNCTLETVASTIAQHRIRPPAIIILGDVAALAHAPTWFEQRPLHGQRILVTRPAAQADGLRIPLEANGADVRLQPAIHIAPVEDWQVVDNVLERLATFDWLAFSSVNGVRYFMDRLLAGDHDIRVLADTRLAAIGPATAAALADYRLKVDLIPSVYRAEDFADALNAACASSRVLLLRASRGREILAERLRAGGNEVEQVVVYNSTDILQPDDSVAEEMQSQAFDWVLVTSPAIARSLHSMFGAALNSCRIASISPVTTATLNELGLQPAVEAREYTMPGLVQALLDYAEALRSSE